MGKKTTVAFTGHRTAKILASTNNPNILNALSSQLDKTISMLYNRGFTTFLSGMAEGFDLLASEAVIRARKIHPEIHLVAVVPFMGQELSYSLRDKERYSLIFDYVDKVEFTSDYYHDKAFFLRNDFLVANSSVMVCYYNTGQRSGTMYTVNRAKKKELQIINLHHLVG